MPRAFIAPLGFHEDFLIRAFTKYVPQSSDRVIAVTCAPIIGGVKRAYEKLLALTSIYRLPNPLLVDLNCADFYGSYKKIRSILRELDNLIICAGGGLRLITIIILTALIQLKKPFTIHYEYESGEEALVVKEDFFYNLVTELSEAEKKTLEAIMSRPGIDIKELAKTIHVKEKTARNIVTRLKKRNLVIKKGKREGLEPIHVAFPPLFDC